ncbi:MAG: MarR family winged helix-turn-helix transcriptional regulator [Terriglobales bacterium]
MPKLSGAKAVQLWEGISRAHTSMTAAIEKEMLPQTGISLGWYEVLAHLRQAPNAMLRFQDLARIEGITDSGASRRLNQMIKAGLIDRHSCPTDRRGVYAHLTDKGRAAYDKAHAVFLHSLDRNLGTLLEPGEAEAVSAALSRLTAEN